MTDTTPRLALAELSASQAQKHVTVNEALIKLDGLSDAYLLSMSLTAPPSSPADGDAYLVASGATGAWVNSDGKIAYCLDDAWRFYAPFAGLLVYNAADATTYRYVGGSWVAFASGSTSLDMTETEIASAATCDIGSLSTVCAAITGTTAITAFGTGTTKLRFVRFEGALTLTHNATSLILLGGASRTTAAGDVGIYTSDASGNWRERHYVRAAADPGDGATKSGSETFTNKTLSGATYIPNGAICSDGTIMVGRTTSYGFAPSYCGLGCEGTYGAGVWMGTTATGRLAQLLTTAGDLRFQTITDIPIMYCVNNVSTWYMGSSGNTYAFYPGSDNAYDFGLVGQRARTLYGYVLNLSTGIVGTTSGSDAASGYVGEYVYSTIASASAVALTTATAANVTSISLSAGDWDVSGLVELATTSATVAANAPVYAGIATTSATLTDTQYALHRPVAVTTTTYAPWLSLHAPTLRLSLTATTTVYLVAQATFTAGTMKAYGTVRARRVR
jgi:hypothetical protein